MKSQCCESADVTVLHSGGRLNPIIGLFSFVVSLFLAASAEARCAPIPPEFSALFPEYQRGPNCHLRFKKLDGYVAISGADGFVIEIEDLSRPLVLRNMDRHESGIPSHLLIRGRVDVRVGTETLSAHQVTFTCVRNSYPCEIGNFSAALAAPFVDQHGVSWVGTFTWSQNTRSGFTNGGVTDRFEVEKGSKVYVHSSPNAFSVVREKQMSYFQHRYFEMRRNGPMVTLNADGWGVTYRTGRKSKIFEKDIPVKTNEYSFLLDRFHRDTIRVKNLKYKGKQVQFESELATIEFRNDGVRRFRGKLIIDDPRLGDVKVLQIGLGQEGQVVEIGGGNIVWEGIKWKSLQSDPRGLRGRVSESGRFLGFVVKKGEKVWANERESSRAVSIGSGATTRGRWRYGEQIFELTEDRFKSSGSWVGSVNRPQYDLENGAFRFSPAMSLRNQSTGATVKIDQLKISTGFLILQTGDNGSWMRWSESSFGLIRFDSPLPIETPDVPCLAIAGWTRISVGRNLFSATGRNLFSATARRPISCDGTEFGKGDRVEWKQSEQFLETQVFRKDSKGRSAWKLTRYSNPSGSIRVVPGSISTRHAELKTSDCRRDSMAISCNALGWVRTTSGIQKVDGPMFLVFSRSSKQMILVATSRVDQSHIVTQIL